MHSRGPDRPAEDLLLQVVLQLTLEVVGGIYWR